MGFLGNLFRFEKPRLFVHSITVVPTDEGMDEEIRAELEGIFGAPNADRIDDPKRSDLGLEIFVPDYRLGDAFLTSASLGDGVIAPLPILFRPHIEIRARLFELSSGKTRRLFRIRRKMAIRKGLSRVFSWRAMTGFTESITKDDVRQLFFDACKELIDALKPYQ